MKTNQYVEDLRTKSATELTQELVAAKKELFNFEVVIEGNGKKVLEQTPSAGEKIEDRSKVRILTE